MVEGRVRADKHGLLWWFHETKRKWIQPYGGAQRKPLSLEAWDSWLNSMVVQGGITYWSTENKKHSAQVIKALAKWWAKGWDKHQSLKVFNESTRITAPLTKVSTRRLIAAQLPGVGWEKSQAIAKHFSSVLSMALATEKEWQAIPGIGKKLAAQIVGELQ
jgi:ERCC4-type nuclease